MCVCVVVCVCLFVAFMGRHKKRHADGVPFVGVRVCLFIVFVCSPCVCVRLFV